MSNKTAVDEFDFRQAFIDEIEKQEKVWSHNRDETVGASEVFACLRRAFFTRKMPEAADPDLVQYGQAERGNIIENNFVVPMVKRIFGDERVLFAAENQESLVLYPNSATPDGLVFPKSRDILKKYGVDDIESDCFALEIKSFTPLMSIEEEKRIHRGQGITQLGLFHRQTKYRPQYVVVLYTNAADFYDIRPFVIKYDEQIFKNAQKRAHKVMDAKTPYDLPAEGKVDDQCAYCPYIAACRSADVDAFVNDTNDLGAGETIMFDEMAAVYLDAHKKEKEASAIKKETAERIKRFLNANATRRAKTEHFSASHANMPPKESLDTEAMLADGINLEKYKKKGNGFTRLQVKAL